jgi:hypothetical protein
VLLSRGEDQPRLASALKTAWDYDGPRMKKSLVTLVLAFAAFVAGFILVTGAIYVVWYVDSWDYNHSPRLSPSDPHDAAAMVLIGEEVVFGLPGGILTGLIAAAVTGVWKWTRAEP